MTTFYLDESGPIGDAVNHGDSNQPFFVLAAIGVADTKAFDAPIRRLRKQHHIQGAELKSKSLVAKPKFRADLINELLVNDTPLFVEVVDKRYFICCNIASFNVLGPQMGYEEGAELNFLRTTLADFLYVEADEPLFNAFVKSCLNPSADTMATSFLELEKLARQPRNEPPKQEIATGLLHMINAARDEYKEILKSDSEAHRRFLPPPDLNKKNKEVWMLPQLTSFTNIYARVNRFYNGKLKEIHIIHDEQLEVEDILRRGKALSESLSMKDQLPYTPGANFIFEESATFEFAKSHEQIGIQLADVLAGTVMRYFRDHQKSGVDPDLKQVMRLLLDQSDAQTGFGINQVVPLFNLLV